MSCPICNHTELEEGVESCPKCGSDLEIFSLIDNAHRADTFQRKTMLTLAGLLGVVMVSWGSVSLFSGDNTERTDATAETESTSAAAPVEDPITLADAGKPVEEFVAENAEVKPEAAPLKPEAKVEDPAEKAPAAIEKPKEKAKPAGPTFEADGYIIHRVRKGDSFWKISRRYFGTGKHAKRIAAENSLNPKKNIPLGAKLRINK